MKGNLVAAPPRKQQSTSSSSSLWANTSAVNTYQPMSVSLRMEAPPPRYLAGNGPAKSTDSCEKVFLGLLEDLRILVAVTLVQHTTIAELNTSS